MKKFKARAILSALSSYLKAGAMRVCLFDLNGTILDDMPVWRETVDRLFARFSKTALTTAEFFRELEKNQGDYLQVYRKWGINASRDELNATFQSIYEGLAPQVDLMPHAMSTLERLAAKDVVLGLVTTQLENVSLPVMTRLGITDLFIHMKFHAIDKCSAITEILASEGISPEDCCYVGDSPSDIRHANKAGVVSVAYLDKHIPAELVLLTRPRVAINSFRQLLELP